MTHNQQYKGDARYGLRRAKMIATLGSATDESARRVEVAEDLTHVSIGGDLPSLAALCGRAGWAA